jgi:dihydropyrimidine dehydrogenase (NAD+) subunit PreA
VPEIIDENCVGCNLCSLVCPVEDCITMERRDDGSKTETWAERTVLGKIPEHFNDPRGGGVGHFVPEPSAALQYKRKDRSGRK